MTKLKKFSVILLCLTLFLTGCTSKPTDETDTGSSAPAVTDASKQKILKLPFSENDSLNPFFAQSEINVQLSELMYQSLYKLNMNYEQQPELAVSGSVSGTKVLVSLGSFSFSDGSSVTADDVVYSFNKAKVSVAYASLLGFFASADSEGGSVVFNLTKENIFALQCLTFPIVKSGTADNKASVPIGSGAYVLDKNNTLTKNKYNPSAKIGTVQLVDVSNAINEAYVLQTGDISFCFDNLKTGSYTKINAVTRSVLLNNLVYIGLNSASPALADANVRIAIASSVDISNIASNAFQGNAVAGRLPFNPNWSKITGINAELNSAAAVSLLEKAGYNKLDKSSLRSNGTVSLNLKLVVNSGNSFRVAAANSIASSLKKIGIGVTVTSLSFADYSKAIQTGEFDMYIGEVKLPDDMSLNAFFASGGSAASGINLSSGVVSQYYSMLSGALTVQSFSEAFLKDMPFIPLCFRTGISASLRGVNLNIETSRWYNNIEDWSY